MMLDVPVVGKVGDSLTSYFRESASRGGDHRHRRREFPGRTPVTRAMRVRLADRAGVAGEKRKGSLPTSRIRGGMALQSPTRRIPCSPGGRHADVLLRHRRLVVGRRGLGEIQPSIGTPLAVGAYVGRVVRVFEEGFAIKFVEPATNIQELERRIIRMPVRRSRRSLCAKAVERGFARLPPMNCGIPVTKRCRAGFGHPLFCVFVQFDRNRTKLPGSLMPELMLVSETRAAGGLPPGEIRWTPKNCGRRRGRADRCDRERRDRLHSQTLSGRREDPKRLTFKGLQALAES